MVYTVTRAARKRLSAGWWLDQLVALGLLLLALPIALHNLDAQSLWLDEGTTQAYVTSNHLPRLLLDLFRPDAAYPLYHLLVKGATRALGDGEWALRLPSALAFSFTAPLLYLLGAELRGRMTGLAAAALLIISPWGLGQAQDVKAYGLALLATVVLVLLFARALRLDARRDWIWFGLAALGACFVHRLLLLSVLGCAACWALFQPPARRRRALTVVAIAAVIIVSAIALGLRWQNAGGQFAGVGPLRALLLTLSQFSVGQFPGTVPRLWLLPFGGLALLGAVRCILDLARYWRRRNGEDWHDHTKSEHGRGATVVLVAGGLPLLLFLALLAVQPLYEPRYLIAVYPFWLLLLGWGLAPDPLGGRRTLEIASIAAGGLLLLGALAAEYRALFQPERGLFSEAPVKEDYRAAVDYLADHVHPDDLVIVYPDTVVPLYHYYAKRVSDHPMPAPTTYKELGRAEGYERRELDIAIRSDFARHKRAWLLIAPDHARLTDPPTGTDELGLVGLAFQYGDQNRRIQCGPPPYRGFVGVRVYCNNIPEIGGKVPEPERRIEATFGHQLRLHGYTITPFEGGPRPGGTLPVTLFWEPLQNLAETDYLVFLHLTRPDDPRPLAQTDDRPMEGGQPTSRWTKPNVLLHDDRTIVLPSDLPPGTYLLRMGVFKAADGTRLVAESAAPVLDDAVVLGEVQIVAP
jgi:mannosyltransferase